MSTELLDVELHCHTCYSPDSLVKLPDLIEHARAIGLKRLAITDHSEIEGALRAYEMAPDLIIVGEEAMTQEGELLCYFIHELIPPNLPLEEAIARVHAQGGICGPSHPLDTRRKGIGYANLIRFADQFDFVEAFNARIREPQQNADADALARELGLPRICCSDAHSLPELGISRTRVRPYDSAADFVAALRDAELVPQYASPLASLSSRAAAVARWLGLA